MSGLFPRYYDRVLADEALSDLDVILLGMYLIERRNNKAGVTYSECRQFFTYVGRKAVNYAPNIHNAKKKPLIDQRDSVLYLTIHGLKRIREILGQIEKTPVHVIRSGQSFTAMKLFEEFLIEEVKAEEILLCDSYVSPATLFPFSILKGKVKSIKLLTTNVHDGDKFKEYRKKMQTETGILVEVKVSGKIHDRYLISHEKCWSIGASIKDLGNKDTTIREISTVTESMTDLFLERWNESPTLS
ncbi:MAG: hypothetical protein ABSG74_01980 [Candidatus Bathyarchaeia archaeon]